MPFYLTNENIEATMERNPDDIFNPSDNEYKVTSNNTSIRQLTTQAFKKNIEEHINKTIVMNKLFTPIDLIKEQIALFYSFKFETDMSEYELIYFIPSSLVRVLSYYQKEDSLNEMLFLNISKAIISSFQKEDFSFLQEISLLDFSEVSDSSILEKLYVLNFLIEDKEYSLYVQPDSEFDKLF